MYTKEQIENKIDTDIKWLERGILAIYERQTNDEKVIEDSRHNNLRGFNKPDAHKLSYYAKWIINGKKLDGWHLENARRKMRKYCGQLTKIANNK